MQLGIKDSESGYEPNSLRACALLRHAGLRLQGVMGNPLPSLRGSVEDQGTDFIASKEPK